MRRLVTTLAGMLGIVLVAVALGYTFATDDSVVVEPTVYPWPTSKPPTPEPIALAEVKAKLDKGDKVVLLDARSREEYEAGHIKGAISLPLSQFDGRFPVIRDRLANDAELIAYCSGASCGLSQRLAEVLIANGFSRVRVFGGGWPEWLAAGYPTESGGSG